MAANQRMKGVRLIPTAEDFHAYKGAHTHKLWRSLPLDWSCPSCKRSRYELLTWREHGRSRLDSFTESVTGSPLSTPTMTIARVTAGTLRVLLRPPFALTATRQRAEP